MATFESFLRTDILDSSLTEDQDKIKTIVESRFYDIVNSGVPESRITSKGSAKNINEIGDLILEAIQDYESRTHASEDRKVNIIYEKPDKIFDLETIAIEWVRRDPGAFSQGAPNQGKVRSLRPVVREVADDPDNPGYKRIVMGMMFDNTLRMTTWARTNKTANERALWLENLMLEYDWFFVYQGVNRMIYQGWQQPEVLNINGNKFYGRPIDYFVRTEKLWNISQKTLEEITIRMAAIPQ